MYASQYYSVPVSSKDKLGGLRQKGHTVQTWTDDGGEALTDSLYGVALSVCLHPLSTSSIIVCHLVDFMVQRKITVSSA